MGTCLLCLHPSPPGSRDLWGSCFLAEGLCLGEEMGGTQEPPALRHGQREGAVHGFIPFCWSIAPSRIPSQCWRGERCLKGRENRAPAPGEGVWATPRPQPHRQHPWWDRQRIPPKQQATPHAAGTPTPLAHPQSQHSRVPPAISQVGKLRHRKAGGGGRRSARQDLAFAAEQHVAGLQNLHPAQGGLSSGERKQLRRRGMGLSPRHGAVSVASLSSPVGESSQQNKKCFWTSRRFAGLVFPQLEQTHGPEHQPAPGARGSRLGPRLR